MPSTKLTLKDKQVILSTARHAIQYGLTYKEVPILELGNYSSRLQQNTATFVTLKETNKLRGCVGTLTPYQPLIQDVAEHAFAAAFRDNRFPPVNHIEEPMLHISVSVLSPKEMMVVKDEKDLISQLEAGKDGIILQYQNHNATFLPAVWESLKDPKTFIKELKLKAGLAENFWSNEMKLSRYTTITID
ncbi:AmmeMemoRadiSam system protein A [Aliikangiella coralliicola]|nr:AmmeMemoRadiSam system protein A [Aliikangiella coralliicola]